MTDNASQAPLYKPGACKKRPWAQVEDAKVHPTERNARRRMEKRLDDWMNSGL